MFKEDDDANLVFSFKVTACWDKPSVSGKERERERCCFDDKLLLLFASSIVVVVVLLATVTLTGILDPQAMTYSNTDTNNNKDIFHVLLLYCVCIVLTYICRNMID